MAKKRTSATRSGRVRTSGSPASKPEARARQPRRPRESLANRRARATRILAALHEFHGPVTCALMHGTALQLLISTILSAQSTDETVNRVTPRLFSRYPTAEGLAAAPPEEIEAIVHPTGFFRQKTKSIQQACRTIVEQFRGEVPGTMEELLQLRGVARKTANVVLGTWFEKNEGIVVDTHVGRLAHRLGLTWRSKGEKDAIKIEQDLMEVIPREEWTYLSHALIWHGRKVCTARKPNCVACVLNTDCPSAFKIGDHHAAATSD